MTRSTALALGVGILAALGVYVDDETSSLAELGALRALDRLKEPLPPAPKACRAAFSVVNERWLVVLPTMTTLHVENSIAAVALEVSNVPFDDGSEDRDRKRAERITAAGWSLPTVALEALGPVAKRAVFVAAAPGELLTPW